MDSYLIVLIVIMSLSIFLQLVIVAGGFVQVRRISSNLEQMRKSVDEKTAPLVLELREIAGQTREVLQTAQCTADNIRGVSEVVKTQVERVNATIDDAGRRARSQIARIDEVVSDAVLRLEATSVIIQQNVLTPVREVSALIRGVSGGLQFLFSGRRNPVNEVHQDEELFI